MSDDRNEEQPAGTEGNSSSDPGAAALDDEARTNGGRTDDPHLARLAADAEPSGDAKRLEYDPAAEDG